MLKVRVSGPTYELKDYLEHMEKDRTRPLTEEGKKDSAIVLEFLKDKKIDAFYCSPYKRSMDTIAEIFDVIRFQDIIDKYKIKGVPCIVINDEHVTFGKKNINEMLALLQAAED